jgi:hypothetical protein
MDTTVYMQSIRENVPLNSNLSYGTRLQLLNKYLSKGITDGAISSDLTALSNFYKCQSEIHQLDIQMENDPAKSDASTVDGKANVDLRKTKVAQAYAELQKISVIARSMLRIA